MRSSGYQGNPPIRKSPNRVRVKKVRNIVEGWFKSFLGDLNIARDFLSIHLPAHIKQQCDLSTLKIAPGAFVEDDLRQYFSDIVYSLQIAGQLGYVYVLIEHQSDAPPLMPFRVLRYQVGVMKQHLDQGHPTLPVVIPLLFYRGATSPYPGPTDIFDCFEHPALARATLLKPFTLIDLSVIPDAQLRTHKSIALLEIIQKHIRAKDVLQFIRDVVELLARYPLPIEKTRSVIQYLLKEGECADYRQLIEFVTEQAPTYREEFMSIAEQLERKGWQAGWQEGKRIAKQLEQKGRQEGQQEGRQEGERQKALAIAKNMLAEGIELSLIQKVTGLLDEDIAVLMQKH